MITGLATLIVLSVIIFIHELGHFIAAKRSGVKVEVFSMGFGPKLLGIKRGETDYMISAIPFGGYVKMAGEDPSKPLGETGREFLAKPRGTRALIVVAGPAMNFLLAVVLYTLLTYSLGVGTITTRQVGDVTQGSPAWIAGLREGDTLVAVGTDTVATWDQALDALAKGLGRRVTIAYERGGVPATATLDLTTLADLGQTGLAPFEEAVIDNVKRDGPAFKAGLRGGDKILTVDGRPVRNWAGVREAIRPSAGKILSITFERHGEVHASSVTPRAEGTTGLIDITYKFERKRVGIGEAAAIGIKTSAWISEQIFVLLHKWVTGQASRDMIGGPVRIGELAGETLRWGVTTFLAFIAALSAQLCLVNLLPVPVLDGGHLLLLAIETVTRRPITMRQRTIAQQIGFVFLVALMITITFMDVSRFVLK
ncbi:MAG TPA: RIP metalloprotease RseP [bacterium]|nr:RIP metalloprotease RseP [bacterium]